MVKNVLGFQIPMDNMVFMDVVDALANLPDYHFSQVLFHWLVLFKKIIQLAWPTKLQNQVDMSGVSEKRIQFNNIGMVEKHLNLYLPG